MDRTPYKESYILQLGQLKAIIDITNGRMISDPPDTLIYENAIFFFKGFSCNNVCLSRIVFKRCFNGSN